MRKFFFNSDCKLTLLRLNSEKSDFNSGPKLRIQIFFFSQFWVLSQNSDINVRIIIFNLKTKVRILTLNLILLFLRINISYNSKVVFFLRILTYVIIIVNSKNKVRIWTLNSQFWHFFGQNCKENKFWLEFHNNYSQFKETKDRITPQKRVRITFYIKLPSSQHPQDQDIWNMLCSVKGYSHNFADNLLTG